MAGPWDALGRGISEGLASFRDLQRQKQDKTLQQLLMDLRNKQFGLQERAQTFEEGLWSPEGIRAREAEADIARTGAQTAGLTGSETRAAGSYETDLATKKQNLASLLLEYNFTKEINPNRATFLGEQIREIQASIAATEQATTQGAQLFKPELEVAQQQPAIAKARLAGLLGGETRAAAGEVREGELHAPRLATEKLRAPVMQQGMDLATAEEVRRAAREGREVVAEAHREEVRPYELRGLGAAETTAAREEAEASQGTVSVLGYGLTRYIGDRLKTPEELTAEANKLWDKDAAARMRLVAAGRAKDEPDPTDQGLYNPDGSINAEVFSSHLANFTKAYYENADSPYAIASNLNTRKAFVDGFVRFAEAWHTDEGVPPDKVRSDLEAHVSRLFDYATEQEEEEPGAAEGILTTIKKRPLTAAAVSGPALSLTGGLASTALAAMPMLPHLIVPAGLYLAWKTLFGKKKTPAPEVTVRENLQRARY